MNSNKPLVLLVEDEEHIREVVKLHLQSLDLEVIEASTGDQGLDIAKQRLDIDLFVLDWMLPGKSGIEICKNIRSLRNESPGILMVTAKTDSDSIVEGLDAGANDYITKPFDVAVFKARVKAQLRRSTISPIKEDNLLKYERLTIDLEKVIVTVDERIMKLTKSEFFMLRTLLEKPGHVFTRGQLIESISGEGIHVNGRTIDTHMVALRKKIAPYNECIETIRGIGYKFSERIN